MKISLTILGEPASKANSRKLVTIGHGAKARPALIKSDKAREYERSALLQIPASARVMLTGPVRVTLHVWYRTERPDLDESVILDVLQARYERVGEERQLIHRGVYVNDRQVREKHVYWHWDPRRPRAEIEVELLEAWLFEPPPPSDRKHVPLRAAVPKADDPAPF